MPTTTNTTNNVTFIGGDKRRPAAAKRREAGARAPITTPESHGMSRDDQLVRIEWRLLQMMAERHIKRNTDLVRKLNAVGVEISTTQLGRLVDTFPERMNTITLMGLLTVLDCSISDLIRVHPPQASTRGQGKP